MNNATRPIPDELARGFDLAVCKRLGLNPEIIEQSTFHANAELVAGDEYGKVTVTLTAHLPADEVAALIGVTFGRQS